MEQVFVRSDRSKKRLSEHHQPPKPWQLLPQFFATIGSLWNSVSGRGLWKEWAEVTVQPVWALDFRARGRSLKQANLKQHPKRFPTLNQRTSRASKISVFTVLFQWQRQKQVSWQELFEVSVTGLVCRDRDRVQKRTSVFCPESAL